MSCLIVKSTVWCRHHLSSIEETAMKFGICTFPTAYAIQPGELASEAETRGFESLWFAEHSHIPVKRETPWPGGDDLPRMYYDVYDPIVALTAAAMTTTTLRLGTGIALVIQRDPIQLAKSIATLDVLSNGRVSVGVGAGWNREEMRNHGTDFERRWLLMRERTEAMKAIWTDDEAEYHGELVDFDPIHSWPKPVQRPHPPIHVGGAVPGGINRAVRYGDGWIPLMGRGDTDFAAHAESFRAAAADAGRDPSTMEISIYAAPPDIATLTAYRDAGVDRVLLFSPTEGRDAALAALDAYAALAAQLQS
jgi:probable F420-dependent oxidoreductase